MTLETIRNPFSSWKRGGFHPSAELHCCHVWDFAAAPPAGGDHFHLSNPGFLRVVAPPVGTWHYYLGKSSRVEELWVFTMEISCAFSSHFQGISRGQGKWQEPRSQVHPGHHPGHRQSTNLAIQSYQTTAPTSHGYCQLAVAHIKILKWLLEMKGFTAFNTRC